MRCRRTWPISFRKREEKWRLDAGGADAEVVGDRRRRVCFEDKRLGVACLQQALVNNKKLFKKKHRHQKQQQQQQLHYKIKTKKFLNLKYIKIHTHPHTSTYTNKITKNKKL